MDKRRLTTAVARYGVNPLVKLALALRILPRAYALIETTGRRSGVARRNPVGIGLDGDTVWIVSEHGRRAAYVRNLEADPRVRVRIGGRWRAGTAHVLPDDDAQARLRTVGTPLSRATVRLLGTDATTVRVDLEPRGKGTS